MTRRLLDHYGIVTPLTPYHEHNAAEARPRLAAQLAAGDVVALVSDAGTPLISDPGFKLAREAGAGARLLTAIPGPSAVLAALSLSGQPTDRFFFEGFLPAKDVARGKRIAELAHIPATLVIFESGPRLGAALAELAAQLGERNSAVCRELTKLHETVVRAPLSELAESYARDGAETRGEIVIVVAPPPDEAISAGDVDEMLRQALARVSVKDAVGEVAAATGRPKREVYQRALELTKDADGA